MKEKEFMRKMDYLLLRLRVDMADDIRKVIKSGCIDIEQADNDYKLPEAVFHAVLRRETERYAPINPYGRKETDNIYKFI